MTQSFLSYSNLFLRYSAVFVQVPYAMTRLLLLKIWIRLKKLAQHAGTNTRKEKRPRGVREFSRAFCGQ